MNTTIQPIPVDQITQNPWNPNEMSVQAFAELVAELERLQDVPKPVIVRPTDDGYEVIDGAHTLMAAQQLGWTEVRCEIRDVNDLEAMRQTWKRNQHGEHNPLLEGEMFQRMIQESSLSQRAFARDMDISAGTVGNALAYVKALKLRIRYTRDKEQSRAEIESLLRRQVRKYVWLPSVLRDKWLDAGADLLEVNYIEKETFEAIDELELAEYVDGTEQGFGASLWRLEKLCNFALEHSDIANVAGYIRPLAEHQAPKECLDYLPYTVEDGVTRVFLTPEEWAELVHKSVTSVSGTEDVADHLAEEVKRKLRAAGIDPTSLTCIDIEGTWQHIIEQEDYQFLAEADYLTTEERVGMHLMKLRVDREIKLRAMKDTCNYFCQRRTGNGEGNGMPDFGNAVKPVFKRFAALHEVLEFSKADWEFLRDPEALTARIMAELASSDLQQAVIDGRPAREVFEERLRAMELPELGLTACLAIGLSNMATMAWLDAIGAVVPDDAVLADMLEDEG